MNADWLEIAWSVMSTFFLGIEILNLKEAIIDSWVVDHSETNGFKALLAGKSLRASLVRVWGFGSATGLGVMSMLLPADFNSPLWQGLVLSGLFAIVFAMGLASTIDYRASRQINLDGSKLRDDSQGAPAPTEAGASS